MRNSKYNRKTKKRNYGGKLSAEAALLADSGKEQLHLIMMILCLFLCKYYVLNAASKKLYPEELETVIEILTKIKNTQNRILSEYFEIPMKDKFFVEDTQRIDKMTKMFKEMNAYKNAPELIQTQCLSPQNCIIKVNLDPNVVPAKQIPVENETLFKQVSFKLRLVLYLEDVIALLTREKTNAPQIDNDVAVARGNTIETKIKVWQQLKTVAAIIKELESGVEFDVFKLGKWVSNLWSKSNGVVCKPPAKTQKGGAIDYKAELTKLMSIISTRFGEFFSSANPETKDKYAFLFYFKIFTQFYDDNTNGKIVFKEEAKRSFALKIGKKIYDFWLKFYRALVKNPIGATILFGSVIASRGLSYLAKNSMAIPPIIIADHVLAFESKVVPIVLAPFVDNPLMPIFRPEDIKKYNNMLISQSEDIQNVNKISQIAENHARIIALILNQSVSVQFNSRTPESIQTPANKVLRS